MNHVKCFGIYAAFAVNIAFAQLPDAATATTTPTPASAAASQRRAIAPENAYHHIITVVPIIGSGTHADPHRPLYAPVPARASLAGLAFLLSPSSRVTTGNSQLWNLSRQIAMRCSS
jgi:hypothetical protein